MTRKIDFDAAWGLWSPHFRGGDLIFFEGGGFLSGAIKFFTRSRLSHVAMLLPPDMPTPGLTAPCIIESTIHKNGFGTLNGPQVNELRKRILEYDKDGRVWWAPLDDRIRTLLDWPAMWALAISKLDRDHYNVAELVAYVGRQIPLVDRLPFLWKPDKDSEVCSEYCAEIYRAGKMPGLRPCQTPPQELAELAIYNSVYQLMGTPATIRDFNSR